MSRRRHRPREGLVLAIPLPLRNLSSPSPPNGSDPPHLSCGAHTGARSMPHLRLLTLVFLVLLLFVLPAPFREVLR